MGEHDAHRGADAELGRGGPPRAERALTAVVIDASAALFTAAEPDGFRRLERYALLAPPLLWSEALSAVRSRWWRGEISAELAKATREAILEAPIESRRPAELYSRAWQISVQLGWAKTYDAEYLALAVLADAPLLTLDARLARVAGRLARVIGPTELP